MFDVSNGLVFSVTVKMSPLYHSGSRTTEKTQVVKTGVFGYSGDRVVMTGAFVTGNFGYIFSMDYLSLLNILETFFFSLLLGAMHNYHECY